ncbi:MAG: FAD-dependent monooxygenase, partial [Nonlabens sp.]
QALLDALSLARAIYVGCRPQSNWKETGLRDAVLNDFEKAMFERTASKVKDSAQAAQFLHSDVVLHKGDEPRGRILKRQEIEE